MGSSPGYDIGASLANAATSDASLNESDGTNFYFSSPDVETDQASEQIPTQTATTTATTALPGGSAESYVPVTSGSGTSAPAGAAAVAATSSSLSTTTILLLAGAAILALHFLKHHAKL